jgi:hypothetical protein
MPSRRASGYVWNNKVCAAAELSPVARTGWGYDNLCLFLTVSGATVITLLVGQPELKSAEGIDPDESEYADDTFFPAFYLDTELKWTFSGGAVQGILVPDFAPLYFRLKNATNGVTVTASWIASGD